MDSNQTKQLANEVFDYVVAFRRELHENPEPSMQEFETTNRVARELDQLGVAYRRMEPTGLVAEITGTLASDRPTRCVALRGDMDALNIEEHTSLPFKSTRPGLMHACGHDTHTAMLLGACRILNEHRDRFAGKVRFLFQPAEEVAAGAKLFVEQGALEGVDYAYGQHIMAQSPVGTVWGATGATMASVDRFKISLQGVTTHGAMPQFGVDASVAAAALVMNLQTMVSREFTPMDPLVVTVGQIHSGTRFNIVSGEAWLDGTVRSFNPATRDALPGVMERIAKATAETFRCTAELEYDKLIGVLVNDPEAMAIGERAVCKVAPDGMMHVQPQLTGGEDFAEYTPHCKAGFFSLGGGGEHPQHSDYFEIDEEAMKTGVAVYVQVALDALEA